MRNKIISAIRKAYDTPTLKNIKKNIEENHIYRISYMKQSERVTINNIWTQNNYYIERVKVRDAEMWDEGSADFLGKAFERTRDGGRGEAEQKLDE